ncbi:MAG: hypothetical protein FWF45_00590 [Coriobacteriia bacterium]|nr:hypothetical protein [Coriobacteriia bacterium]
MLIKFYYTNGNLVAIDTTHFGMSCAEFDYVALASEDALLIDNWQEKGIRLRRGYLTDKDWVDKIQNRALPPKRAEKKDEKKEEWEQEWASWFEFSHELVLCDAEELTEQVATMTVDGDEFLKRSSRGKLVAGKALTGQSREGGEATDEELKALLAQMNAPSDGAEGETSIAGPEGVDPESGEILAVPQV